MTPTGRRAIVTGAGGGIGGACARALAARGVHVALFDIDEAAAAQTLADIVERQGQDQGQGACYGVDCGDPDAIHAAMAADAAAFGVPDIIVSAVALERHGTLLETAPDDLRAAFDTTVTGALALLSGAARAMIPRGGGQIVVISSPHAVRPFPGALAYNVAEAGLRQLALTAAHELARHRICVNLVEPGWIDTPGERRLYSAAFLDASAAKLPWGRRGTPEEIAAAVVYLTSEEARYVSGATIRVDGALGVSLARLPGLEIA